MATDPHALHRRRARAASAFLTALASLALAAPSAAQVSDADLERARRLQPQITDQDLERVQRQFRGPTEVPVLPAPPQLDALPQPAAPPPLDLATVAERFAREQSVLGQSAPAAAPSLLIFISLTMPEPTLTKLVAQAAKAEATLVLRGFENGSLRDTVRHLQRLIGRQRVAAQIDPESFDRYAITQVPTFVLARSSPVPCPAAQCPLPTTFVAVSGDVSLPFALEQVERQAPRFRQAARTYLDRLARSWQ